MWSSLCRRHRAADASLPLHILHLDCLDKLSYPQVWYELYKHGRSAPAVPTRLRCPACSSSYGGPRDTYSRLLKKFCRSQNLSEKATLTGICIPIHVSALPPPYNSRDRPRASVPKLRSDALHDPNCSAFTVTELDLIMREIKQGSVFY